MMCRARPCQQEPSGMRSSLTRRQLMHLSNHFTMATIWSISRELSFIEEQDAVLTLYITVGLINAHSSALAKGWHLRGVENEMILGLECIFFCFSGCVVHSRDTVHHTSGSYQNTTTYFLYSFPCRREHRINSFWEKAGLKRKVCKQTVEPQISSWINTRKWRRACQPDKW